MEGKGSGDHRNGRKWKERKGFQAFFSFFLFKEEFQT